MVFIFILLAWWSRRKGNPEYRRDLCTLLHTGLFSGFKGCPGQYDKPGFLRALSMVSVNTFCSSAFGQIDPWITSSTVYWRVQSYTRWLVALHRAVCGWGSDRIIVSWAALICLNHELIFSDSSTMSFPAPTTGTAIVFSPALSRICKSTASSILFLAWRICCASKFLLLLQSTMKKGNKMHPGIIFCAIGRWLPLYFKISFCLYTEHTTLKIKYYFYIMKSNENMWCKYGLI